MVKRYGTCFSQAVDSPPYFAINYALEEGIHIHKEFFSPIINKWIFLSAIPSEEGVIVTIRDIQEIKDAKLKLEEEHLRLKEAQALGRLGSFDWKVGEETVYWSDEMYRINGMEPQSENISVHTSHTLIHPDDLEMFERIKEVSVAEPGSYRLDHRIIGRDGVIRYVAHQFESIGDEAGNIVRVHGTLQDVTTQRKAEEQLKDSKSLLQTAINTSLNSFNVCRAIRNEDDKIIDFEIILTNNKFQSAGVDLADENYSEMFPGIKDTGIFEKFVQATEGALQDFEVNYTHEGYNNWFRIVAVKLGDGFLNTAEDITERKKAEQEIQKNLTILQQTEDIAAIGSWEYHIPSGRFSWSDGMYRMFDYPKGAPVQPEVYIERAPAPDKAVARRIVNSIKETHKPFEEELHIKRGDGERLLKVKGTVVMDERGKPLKVVGCGPGYYRS